MKRARFERRKSEHLARKSVRGAGLISKTSWFSRRSIAIVAAFLVGAAVAYPITHYQSRVAHEPDPRSSGKHPDLTLCRLLEMSSAELADGDIVQMNLLCAKGLPGTESLDISKALKIVDYWTDRVDLETRRNRHRFNEHPEEYENSEIYYLMGMIVTVLQQDLGVRYNPDLTDSDNLSDSAFLSDASNVFVSGLLSDKRMGTCASMPVLYVAIGRRLSYPVRLAQAHDHLFVRWRRPGEDAFRNLEATSRGVVFQTDEYYKKWRKIPEEEIKSGVSLRSLTSQQELATFMQMRAAALRFHKRLSEAVTAYSEAVRLWPENRNFKTYLADAIVRLAPKEFTPAFEENRPLSAKQMIDQRNDELLKRERPDVNWDLVEHKNHNAPKNP